VSEDVQGNAPAHDRPVTLSAQTLLRDRKFAPFFWVQFTGALNDNIFKVGFTSVVTYQAVLFGVADARNAAFLIAAIFVLPFLLFSATAGQLADKYDKAVLMQAVKTLEIGIMVLASAGFLMHSAHILYVSVFLMGLHSTIFGPAKYAYLPDHLEPGSLLKANGIVEMGTFASILLGTMIGGTLASQEGGGGVPVAVLCLSCALTGRVVAAWIPSRVAAAPALTINWHPFTETWRNLVLAAADRTILVGLIGISWLWFIGAIFLTSFFSFARDVLLAGPNVVTLLLGVFTVGIGLGSLLCGRVSTTKRGLGLVPLGGLGMTIFAVDLYLGSRGLANTAHPLAPNALYSISSFLSAAQHWQHWRLLIDLFLLALSGGLYSVPLYAMIQSQSVATHRARIIAANNIFNALFMVGASVLAMALGALGASIPMLYLLVGLLNALVVMGLCWRAPDIARQSFGLLREWAGQKSKGSGQRVR